VRLIDPQGFGDRFDPLNGKHTEDELLSSATHLLFQADEGEGKIFTQRAITMLTMLFLASRKEGIAPLRAPLTKCATESLFESRHLAAALRRERAVEVPFSQLEAAPTSRRLDRPPIQIL